MDPFEEILRQHFRGQGDDDEEDQGGLGSILNMMRGGGGRTKPARRPKMKPMQYALEATLDEIYSGSSTKMRLSRMRVCKKCKGYSNSYYRKGCKPGATSSVCQTCKGKRIVTRLQQLGPGMYTQSRGPCEECNGKGDNLTEEDRCPACKGERISEDKKEFEVKLDPGVPDNHTYNFPGEGNETVLSFII